MMLTIIFFNSIELNYNLCSHLRESVCRVWVVCQNLLRQLVERFLAVLFLKNMELAWNEDDADVIISKPNVPCKEECDQYLSIPAISAKSE